MPAIRRTLKNVVKNYSDAQVKVREATSNDPWGPSSTLMTEIADLTYNVVAFTEIMQMIWKRLNDDGKNWRHVYKSLVVLDYIIKTGSDKVAQQCKENFHAIKTLTSFQYIDADNKDQGMNVREKAKQLVAMLSDDERLKNERAKALKAKERFAQNAMGVGNGHGTSRTRMRLGGSPPIGSGYQDTYGYPDSASPGSGSAGTPSEMESARPSSAGEEELQLQLALAMSKEEHEEQIRKQKTDDIKLQMAIEQSKEQAKNDRRRQQQQQTQYPTNSQPSAFLDLAGPSSNADPWGMPLPAQTTDPWGAPLYATTAPPDPWGSSSASAGGGGARPAVYSPVQGVSAQPADPWGVPAPSPQSTGGAWSSASPTPQASAWGAPSPASSAGPDIFTSSKAPVTNGTSSTNNIDSEFDLLSARSTETSPVKNSVLDEFDLLGGAHTNGTSGDAFNMDELRENMPESKKKSAEAFLGGHANLVNLDQLVARAPPKANNPFAMTTTNSNPFQDPSAGVRLPMAHMAPVTATPGFIQPVNTGLLPAPLLPMGSTHTQPHTQPQGYNPFL
ncbi:epsin-1-like isoform X1 [Biomphalaria glabrata]|uniref:Epsin-1-like isoform X1 n=1 Tax=Biomphalaria glabrata TaxID=6526 RepID=A0A2C9K5X4_BIOGL|nr:epsin-1-like isoform X1 [Biomphalaria glabrata]XP_055875397.1 epsin-1-like isoform X1 [Biomphalaria glabrata]XP_055875398.1 epsin-1-like isoform X1 [Biomphalaria glabrata]XP_055875399.1 epsin-1-like isoform X1 [Biomphalaria glabrata]XP_055875402.1 epsin-1-like isoform X1 [Biomphalaria glabrata]